MPTLPAVTQSRFLCITDSEKPPLFQALLKASNEAGDEGLQTTLSSAAVCFPAIANDIVGVGQKILYLAAASEANNNEGSFLRAVSSAMTDNISHIHHWWRTNRLQGRIESSGLRVRDDASMPARKTYAEITLYPLFFGVGW